MNQGFIVMALVGATSGLSQLESDHQGKLAVAKLKADLDRKTANGLRSYRRYWRRKQGVDPLPH